MSTKNVDDISSAQCRAARALLAMTQPELAARAGLGLSTIVDFEKSRRRLSAEAIKSIRDALESAGVIFINQNGDGPGVRLRKRRRG
jgi:transcriptional regulator with XRE-family HTH domain